MCEVKCFSRVSKEVNVLRWHTELHVLYFLVWKEQASNLLWFVFDHDLWFRKTVATCQERILRLVAGHPCLCDQKSDLLIDPNYNLLPLFHLMNCFSMLSSTHDLQQHTWERTMTQGGRDRFGPHTVLDSHTPAESSFSPHLPVLPETRWGRWCHRAWRRAAGEIDFQPAALLFPPRSP